MESNTQSASPAKSEGIFKRFTQALSDLIPRSPRAVWFELRDGAGKPFKFASVSKVICPYGSDIADFCVAVQLKCNTPGLLFGMSAVQLSVYESLSAFESFDKTLEHGDKIKDTWGSNFKYPLIVIVPPSGPLDPVVGSLSFNNEYVEARKSSAQYQKIASHLVNEPSVL